jgi:hypothetical protein
MMNQTESALTPGSVSLGSSLAECARRPFGGSISGRHDDRAVAVENVVKEEDEGSDNLNV